MIISIVAAHAKNGIIGNKGKLPWYISENLKRFKDITEGSVVIMGRKTYESLGKPLKNRHNIVVSKSGNLNISAEEALEACVYEKEVFIIGGESLYKQTLPFADKLYLTILNDNYDGDTSFPKWSKRYFKETYRKEKEFGVFLEFERK